MDIEESSEQSLTSILSDTYDKIQETPEQVETDEVEAQAETQEAESVETTEDVAPETEDVVVEQLEAPDSWRAEAKAKFAELPPEIQQEVLKREDDVKNGFAEYTEDRKFAKSMRDVVNPYMALIQAEGGTAETAVASLLQTAAVLRTGTPDQKRQALQEIARNYGIDTSESYDEDEYIDPQVAELKHEINNLKQGIQQSTNAKAQAEIAEFKSKHEHFDALSPTMAKLMQAGEAVTLSEAYEKAQWLVPDVREAMLTKQREEDEAKRKQEQAEAAKKAKKAAGVQLTSKASVKGQDKPATMRETLERTFERIQSA